MKTEIFTTAQRSIPLRVRITKADEALIKNLSKEKGRPVATIAYALFKHALENYQEK